MALGHLDKLYEQEGPIGGEGRTVGIDETKIGRRKYERGRFRTGVWIVGLIDLETKQFRIEPCRDNKRD